MSKKKKTEPASATDAADQENVTGQAWESGESVPCASDESDTPEESDILDDDDE
jgi:hypothetical protein